MRKKIKYTEFGVCEKCAKSPAIYRHFCAKVLCWECAEKAFKKYLKKLLITVATVIVVICLVVI